MSASRPANMRGPWLKTPVLILLLLTTLTGTVLCQSEDDGADSETVAEEEVVGDSEPTDVEASESTPAVSDPTLPPDPQPTEEPVDEDIEVENGSGRSLFDVILTTDELSTLDPSVTPTEEEQNLIFIIIPILVVLVVVIIGIIVCGIFINRKWNRKTQSPELKDDPYLDGSSTEKVPMPMFEEDVPSVLELEMEELDQWMKTDGETAEDSNHAEF